MSALGLKEKAMLAAVVMVVLYAVAAGVWFLKMDVTSRRGEWNRARRKYQEACRKYRSECKLIGDRDEWIERYDEEKTAMPKVGSDLATDTTWMAKVGEVAKRHNVEISSRKAGRETTGEGSEVCEMEIDCSFEASLEALVRFMHELENPDKELDGMFDFKSISFKPSSRKGYLKGSFVVNCAYMRE